MEKGAYSEVSGGLFRLLGIALRVGTIVLAVILIGVSAATIGIIENNEALERVQDADRGFLSRAVKDLQDLINQSLGAGGWLIALSVCVLIGETVAIVLETVPIVLAAINFQPLKLVRQIFDIVFSIAVAICYGATGTACAVYAAEWGEPPELCDPAGIDCDDAALTTTNTLSTVLSFIQTAVFGFLAIMVVYAIVKSRKV